MRHDSDNEEDYNSVRIIRDTVVLTVVAHYYVTVSYKSVKLHFTSAVVIIGCDREGGILPVFIHDLDKIVRIVLSFLCMIMETENDSEP